MIKKEHLPWISLDKGVDGYQGVVFTKNAIMSYDGSTAIKIETKCDIEMTIDGDTLKSFLSRCPGDIKMVDKGDHLLVSSGRSRAKLPPVESKQEVEEINFDIEMNEIDPFFINGLHFCHQSSAKGPVWGNLASVVIVNDTMFGTNTRSISIINRPDIDLGQAVIPETMIDKIVKLNPDKAYISREKCVFQKQIDDDTITMIVSTMVFDSQNLNDENRELLMNIHKHEATHEIEFDGGLNDVIDQGLMFADYFEFPIALKINSKGVFVKIQGPKGEFSARGSKGIEGLDTEWFVPIDFKVSTDDKGNLLPLQYNDDDGLGTFKVEGDECSYYKTFKIERGEQR